MKIILLWMVSFLSLFLSIFWVLVIYTKKKEKSSIDTNLPGISILVPALNEEKTIAKTLNSLLSSNYPNLEVIVINDQSTDSTPLIVSKFTKKFRNVKLLHNIHKGIGKASALNLGLKHASGKILGVVDSDSEISKDALLNMMPYFQDTQTAAVISAIKVKDPNNLYQGIQRIEYILATFSRTLMSKVDALHVTPGALSLYRASLIKELNGFDENNLTEDLEIAMRLKYHGYNIKIAPNALSYTNVPSTFKSLWNQRVRWFRGFIYNTSKYRKMFLSRQHGIMGRFQIPINFITLAAILLSSSIIIYEILRNIYLFALRMAALNWDVSSLYYRFPSTKELILNVNTNIFFPAATTFLLSLYILNKAHKSSGERWILSPALIVYFTIYPIIRMLHWLAAFYKEAVKSKRKW